MVPVSRKKPPAKQPTPQDAAGAETFLRNLDHAVLDLEDAVFCALDINKERMIGDSEERYWDRQLKSIATPVSLALAEYRGPRRMHLEYSKDTPHHLVTLPISGEAPLSLLARVCFDSLKRCQQMDGVHDALVNSTKDELEHALRMFLYHYQRYLPGQRRKSKGHAS